MASTNTLVNVVRAGKANFAKSKTIALLLRVQREGASVPVLPMEQQSANAKRETTGNLHTRERIVKRSDLAIHAKSITAAPHVTMGGGYFVTATRQEIACYGTLHPALSFDVGLARKAAFRGRIPIGALWPYNGGRNIGEMINAEWKSAKIINTETNSDTWTALAAVSTTA